jgi:hypothetical protein
MGEHAEPTDDEMIEGEVIHLDGGTVETIEAVSVQIHQGGVNRVLASEVEMHLAAAGRVDAESVVAQQSIILAGRGDEIGAEQAFSAALIAQDARLHASRVGLAVADTALLDQSRATILLAREVHGDVETVLDARGAAVAGIVAGAVAGLVLLLGSRLLRRR